MKNIVINNSSMNRNTLKKTNIIDFTNYRQNKNSNYLKQKEILKFLLNELGADIINNICDT